MPNVNEILSARNLVGVIQGVKPGIAYKNMPTQFMNPNRSILGNSGTYIKVEGTRELARLVQYGSPSKLRGQKGISTVPVTLIHSFEHILHSPNLLQALMNYEDESIQRMGMQEISRQTQHFADLFTNLRIAAVMTALLKGIIYFDSEGNLLASSSGAAISIDYGVPASNKNQLTDMSGTAIIDVSWAGSPDISNQLTKLQQTARQRTGYDLEYAFYGDAVFEYIRTYLNSSGLMSGNGDYQRSFANGIIPNGLFGFNWIPAYNAFFVDHDGTAQTICGSDQITFTPAPTPDWWEVIEGSYIIPNNLGGITPDGVSALSNLTTVFGKFSYAKILDDPASIKHMAGDTFLPVVKVPSAIYVADVVF